MNIQRVNFEDLLSIYYHGTPAHEAAVHLGKLIQGKQQRQLATLLRDYRERAITSPEEIELRAAIDRLMKFYSIMEIASLTDFIPPPQQTDFGAEMRIILEDGHVRRYYEVLYPEKMPQLFRSRLTGANGIFEKVDPQNINHTILVFLDLDRRFMEKLDDGYLLRMLDSFTIRGLRFSNVVELVSKPDKFIEYLLLPPQKSNVMSLTINEFSLFMQFCFDLKQLLSQTESYPLMQSAIWSHYGYWFDIIGGELRGQLGEALSQFLDWKPRGDDKSAAKAIQDYVNEARIVLQVLTSQKFAGPINEALKRAMRLENGPQQPHQH